MTVLSTKEKIKLWDNAWSPGNYDASTSYSRDLIRREHVEGKRVLEIGCGDMIFALHPHVAAKYMGVDISLNALKRAKSIFPEFEFVQVDATSLPFASNSFDTVIAISTITCSGSDAKGILSEAGRVLCKNGELIFDSMHADFFKQNNSCVEVIGKENYGTLMFGKETNTELVVFDEQGITSLLKSVGLRVKDINIITEYEHANLGVPIFQRMPEMPEEDVKHLMVVTATPE